MPASQVRNIAVGQQQRADKPPNTKSAVVPLAEPV